VLVLTRKIGEEIVIGNDIRLIVVAIHGKYVRLGFSAPVETPIRRSELLRKADTEPGEKVSLPEATTDITSLGRSPEHSG
jgi:carbon storage regulator